MKRIIALLLALLMISLMVPVALGEAAEADTSDETESVVSESKVEQIMLKKGSAIIKQFVDCKAVKVGTYDKVVFQTANITDVETGITYFGIRIKFDYWTSKYDNGTAVALIDSDEIDSILSTLEYIKEHKSEFVNYTEVTYTSNGGFNVGAYKNSSETGIVFKSGSKQALIGISYLDDIINGFKEAQTKIQN